MKTLFLFAALISCLSSFAQKKLYATVFDEDNNPIARGEFKSAADSGVIIVVDEMEIFVNATEITILKIEKNPSTSQFLKLGTTTATEVANYLVNKPKKEETVLFDSAFTAEPIIATETKAALFQRINQLVENLLNGKNDLATFNINNSSEKFLTKLRLLQEYSIDKEVVAWNDYSQAQQSTNEISNEEPPDTSIQDAVITDEAILTNTSAKQENQGYSIPPKPQRVTLNRGFSFVRPKKGAIRIVTVKPGTAITASKDVIIVPTQAPEQKQTKPLATVPVKLNNHTSENKQVIVVPTYRSPEEKQTKPAATVKSDNQTSARTVIKVPTTNASNTKETRVTIGNPTIVEPNRVEVKPKEKAQLKTASPVKTDGIILPKKQ